MIFLESMEKHFRPFREVHGMLVNHGLPLHILRYEFAKAKVRLLALRSVKKK